MYKENKTMKQLAFFMNLSRLTSRKHDKKELQSFSHYGSFDHPDLQTLNKCRIVFLVYQLKF
jgi:hypothetical protein